jgi:hypothetical protein
MKVGSSKRLIDSDPVFSIEWNWNGIGMEKK